MLCQENFLDRSLAYRIFLYIKPWSSASTMDTIHQPTIEIVRNGSSCVTHIDLLMRTWTSVIVRTQTLPSLSYSPAQSGVEVYLAIKIFALGHPVVHKTSRHMVYAARSLNLALRNLEQVHKRMHAGTSSLVPRSDSMMTKDWFHKGSAMLW